MAQAGRRYKGGSDAPYRLTARLPRMYGDFMAELAYRHRGTIQSELSRMIAEEMEREPDIAAAVAGRQAPDGEESETDV